MRTGLGSDGKGRDGRFPMGKDAQDMSCKICVAMFSVNRSKPEIELRKHKAQLENITAIELCVHKQETWPFTMGKYVQALSCKLCVFMFSVNISKPER